MTDSLPSSSVSPTTTTLPPKSGAMLERLSPASLRDLIPAQSERALFVGRTGSGKTTLVERMARYMPYVAVLDMKHKLFWEGYERHATLQTLMDSKHTHLIYAPSWDEMKFDTRKERWSPYVEQFFTWIRERENTTCCVDEVMRITRGDQMPDDYHAIITLGRELEIGVWNATQRPTRIPQVLLSEAEHFFVFDLQLEQDTVKMEETLGANISSRKGHEFVYMKNDEIEPRKFILLP